MSIKKTPSRTRVNQPLVPTEETTCKGEWLVRRILAGLLKKAKG